MKTAKDIISVVVAPVKEFFGIKPKTNEQRIRAKIAESQALINIEERAGKLFIIYKDESIRRKISSAELASDMTVEEAISKLQSARSAYVGYSTL